MPDAKQFEKALLSMDRVAARRLIYDELAGGAEPLGAVETLVTPTLEAIGRQWEHGELALSQVYMSGRICEALIDEILPPEDDRRLRHPATAIAVLEDYHLLGKRIVASALRAAGWTLVDYGRIEADRLVQRVRKDGIEVLLISALMLPSALRVSAVTEALSPLGVRIIVGGAPFRLDPELWREVGADATAPDATHAVELMRGMFGEVRP